jgi:hypothetical protein
MSTPSGSSSNCRSSRSRHWSSATPTDRPSAAPPPSTRLRVAIGYSERKGKYLYMGQTVFGSDGAPLIIRRRIHTSGSEPQLLGNFGNPQSPRVPRRPPTVPPAVLGDFGGGGMLMAFGVMAALWVPGRGSDDRSEALSQGHPVGSVIPSRQVRRIQTQHLDELQIEPLFDSRDRQPTVVGRRIGAIQRCSAVEQAVLAKGSPTAGLPIAVDCGGQ